MKTPLWQWFVLAGVALVAVGLAALFVVLDKPLDKRGVQSRPLVSTNKQHEQQAVVPSGKGDGEEAKTPGVPPRATPSKSASLKTPGQQANQRDGDAASSPNVEKQDGNKLEKLAPETAKAGDVWIHPRTQKKMISVPSGYYRPNKACASWGGVPIPITITVKDTKTGEQRGLILGLGAGMGFITGFFMDATEVTNGEYLRYVKATQAAFPKDWNGKEPTSEELQFPARVSYQEALTYAKWARLRLPELEDFCAATAAKDGVFPWKNHEDSKGPHVAPVASNPDDISPLGISDLGGNISEYGGMMLDYEGRKYRFVLWLQQMNGLADAEGKRVPTNVAIFSDPEELEKKGCGFRCIYDTFGLLGAKPAQGRGELEEPKDIPKGRVKIQNTVDSVAVLLLSNGQRIEMPAKGDRIVELPIGKYYCNVLFNTSVRQLTIVYPVRVNEIENTWLITPNRGEEIKLGQTVK